MTAFLTFFIGVPIAGAACFALGFVFGRQDAQKVRAMQEREYQLSLWDARLERATSRLNRSRAQYESMDV